VQSTAILQAVSGQLVSSDGGETSEREQGGYPPWTQVYGPIGRSKQLPSADLTTAAMRPSLQQQQQQQQLTMQGQAGIQ